MTYAYQVTQFNGIDYSTKSPKWNLVAERRTQQQALAVCQALNTRQPYFHRVEVVKAVELPKFTNCCNYYSSEDRLREAKILKVL